MHAARGLLLALGIGLRRPRLGPGAPGGTVPCRATQVVLRAESDALRLLCRELSSRLGHVSRKVTMMDTKYNHDF